MFFGPLNVWPRVAIPALLILGFIGSVFRMKILRFFGWAGIVGFTLLVVITSIKNVDDNILQGTSHGMPNIPTAEVLVPRFVFLITVAVVQIICYRRLGRKTSDVPVGSDATGRG
jgi:hypothetical protein